MTSVQPGYWDGIIVSVDLTEAGTGSEQVAVTCEFPEFDNARLTWYGGFSNDRAINWTADCLRFAGYDPWLDQWAKLSEIAKGTDTPIAGNKVRTKVIEDDYRGDLKIKLKTFVDPSGGVGKKLEDAKKSGLMDRLKAAKQLSEDERFAGGRQTAGAAAAPGRIDVDEAPF